MRVMTNLLKTFIKDEKKILGRWNIDYCKKKIDNKIDLSNEDHCGPCGQYVLKKIENNQYDKSINTNTNDYNYLRK
jgi:hypothetical protein